MRNYAAIYGVLYVSSALGAGIGPFGFGRDYDLHGNYHLSLTISLIMLLLSAASFLALGRYHKFADEPIVDANR